MATFMRKLFGHFGIRKDDAPRKPVQQSEDAGKYVMKIAVPAEATFRVPIVSHSAYGNGGVQGLKWYFERLLVDNDGDVAQEFFHEVIPERWDGCSTGTPPRLESVADTRPALLKGPVSTRDGNVHQCAQS